MACFRSRGSDEYPAAHLLPRPSYRLLLPPNHHVSTGWLLRRTTGKNVFAPAAAGRQLIHDPKQLCSPTKLIIKGFSVNLWGHFRLRYNGWKPTVTGQVKTDQLWQPPQPAQPPTTAEMCYLDSETWDVVGFSIAELDGHMFNLTEFGLVTAFVCHTPNCWNYWHYEVRFQDAQGKWLDRLTEYDPVPYKNKRLERLQNNLLASFIQAGLAQPIATVSTPVSLPRAVYDTCAPWWANLLRR